jgi:hypothetical protein
MAKKEIILNEEDIIKIIAKKLNVEPTCVDLCIKQEEFGDIQVIRAIITQDFKVED